MAVTRIRHPVALSRSCGRPRRPWRGERAFTLVELLIVFVILGLLLGLVGPIAVERMDRARAQEEWLIARRTLTGLAFRAYVDGRAISIEADGARLSWRAGPDAPRAHDFAHLFFPSQRVVINSHGIAEPARLTVQQGPRERVVELNGWLDERS